MKQPIKKGTSPTKQNVSSLSDSNDLSLLYNQPTILDVPESCKKELADKKMEYRWIDLVALQRDGGLHKKNWQPYKFECLGKSESNPFGGQAGQYDGYLVRRQLVLASKTAEAASLERRKVQLRTKLQSDPASMKVKEMKQFVKDAGVKIGVTGAEDDED